MEKNFWINKWLVGDTRFHQNEFEPQLVKYGSKLSIGTILVPLCGKTLDMIYLTTLGHKVIGVELSPIACQNFFTENNVEYTERKTDEFTVFQSINITLWCGDFFKLPQSEWDKITGVYDRAALIALPEDVRKKYAHEMLKAHKLEILLIGFEYPEGSLSGPPFSVSENEIKKIYQGFKHELLEVEVDENLKAVNPRFEGITTTESVYFLKR